jgi:dTDP-4-dehydrorhamnose 3,5-epimerase-like enzyme
MDIKVKKLTVKSDERGWLTEIVRQEEVKRKKTFGQIYLTVAKPGITKGKHYHTRKTEYFCVIKGNGTLYLIDNNTHEKKNILMGQKNFVMVEIPPYIWHAIKNTGREDLYLLGYIDEPMNPVDPDTFGMEYRI